MSSFDVVLIDGDIVAYRCAAASEDASLGIAALRQMEMMHGIQGKCAGVTTEVYLTGERNFRKEIAPEYKANRTAPRPRHLEDLRELLVVGWRASVTDGYEADDAISIRSHELRNLESQPLSSVVASIDKDLRQIPGWHYHITKEELTYVSEEEAIHNFYVRCLTGDSTDNVFGVPGIGDVRAARALRNCQTSQEKFEACRKLFKDDRRFLKTGRLIHLLRTPEDEWNFPELEQEKVASSESIVRPQDQNDLFMGLTCVTENGTSPPGEEEESTMTITPLVH